MKVVFYTKCMAEWIKKWDICGVLASKTPAKDYLHLGFEEDLDWTKALMFK